MQRLTSQIALHSLQRYLPFPNFVNVRIHFPPGIDHVIDAGVVRQSAESEKGVYADHIQLF